MAGDEPLEVACTGCGWAGEVARGEALVCPNCDTSLTVRLDPEEEDSSGGMQELDPGDMEAARAGVRSLIRLAGADPGAEGLAGTPDRVVRAVMEMSSGYDEDPAAILSVTFDGGDPAYDELVVLRGIPFVSLCEHHLLPFSGEATIAYLPRDGRVVGVSKLARLLECYARRFQIQERLSVQVVEALDRHLSPLGSACVIRAAHQCMACRGVRKPGAVMVTSALTGKIRQDPALRAELLALSR